MSVCFWCLHALVFAVAPRVLHLRVSWLLPASPAVKAHDAIRASVACWWSFWTRLISSSSRECDGCECGCARLFPSPKTDYIRREKAHIWFSSLTAVGNENHVSFMPDISWALQCVAILSVLEREESQSAGRKHSFFLSFLTVSGRLLLRWVTAPFSKSQIKQCAGWLLLLIFISHLPLFWPLASKEKQKCGQFLEQAIQQNECVRCFWHIFLCILSWAWTSFILHA